MKIGQATVNKRTNLFSMMFGLGSMSLLALFVIGGLTSSALPEFSQFLFTLLVPPVIPGIVFYTLFCLWIASLIAKMAWKKGRSWHAFFVLSLFFPVIAWIIAVVVSTDQATVTSGTKKCPRCAELIKQEANLCKHCGSEV